MKSHMWLLAATLRDCAVQCSVPTKEVVRDLRTISSRVEHEGISFLTITLPSVDEALLRGLADGRWPPAFSSFKKKGGLPAFLQGFLRLVFDADGRLLDAPDITAIACLRQIAVMFKKVQLDCTKSREAAAFERYVEIDVSIPDMPDRHVSLGAESPDGPKGPTVDAISRTFRYLFARGLIPLDRKIYEGEPLAARHGPGATAERVKYNAKFAVTDWTQRLDQVFCSDLYTHAYEWTGPDEDQDRCIEPGGYPTPEQEKPVRVISVPKTQKGPRIIAIEPVVMQFMQQGLLDGLVEAVAGTCARRSLNFDDQRPNAVRALLGSMNCDSATLDLKEASDRVPFWLVRQVFAPVAPHVWGALEATRSERATVPDPSGRLRERYNPGGVPGGYGGVCDDRVSRLVTGEPVAGVHVRPGSRDPGSSGSRGPRGNKFPRVSRSQRTPHDTSEISQLASGCSRGESTNPAVRGGDGFTLGNKIPRVGAALPQGVSSSHPTKGGGAAMRRTSKRGHSSQIRSYTFRLRKFASMGSAVCFPVEAMVFLSIAIAGVIAHRSLPLTYTSVRKVAAEVNVFGDDIIVPTDTAPTVIRYLEAFGLVVNRNKSFWTGKFRESCGTDAYDGVDVTPVYLRNMAWDTVGDKDWVASWASFSNQLYARGFWETARAVRERLDRTVGPLPMVSPSSPAVGYHNVRRTHSVDAWDRDLHRWKVRAFTYRPSWIDSKIDGAAAMRKCLPFRKRDERPFGWQKDESPLTNMVVQNKDHLAVAVRSASVSTKRRWTSPY